MSALLAGLLLALAIALARGPDPGARAAAVLRSGAGPALATDLVPVAGRMRRAAARRFANGRGEVTAARSFVEAWAAALRAGRPAQVALASAIEDVPLARPLLRRTAASLPLGGDLASALAADARAAQDPVVRRTLTAVVACWTVAQHSGGRLADALDRLAEAVRGDEQHTAHVRAQLAGPRSTARLLAALPVLALLMSSSLGLDAWAVLTQEPHGRAVLVAGVALDALGLWWTARLARAAERSA